MAMKTTMICTVALAAFAGCVPNDRWEVPDAWKPTRFAAAPDSEFLFVANNNNGGLSTNGIPELMARTPSMADMVPVVRCRPVKRKDGTVTYNVVDHRGVPTNRLFFISICPRISVYARTVLLDKIRHDMDAYEEWKKAHPNFLGFYMDEWYNDITLPFISKGKWLTGKGRGNQRFTEAENAAVMSSPAFAKAPGNRGNITTNLIPSHIRRIFELQFNDPKMSALGEGVACTGHLAAYEGAGAIGIETTRNYTFYQVQEMFCRGAARQFSIPWMWYVASYHGGVYSDGRMSWQGTRFAVDHPKWKMHGPAYGISLSAIERTTYKTWLSGAASYERETMEWTHFQRDRVPLELSDEGRMYDRFWHVATENVRGVPYTPIALLVPRDRGKLREPGPPYRGWMGCRYTQADYMLDAVISVALDFPKNSTRVAYTSGVERVMANSSHGDVFDVLTPDFPDQSSFRRTVGAYPCAILTGEYGDNPEMEEILRGYVSGGGTLVLNEKQLTRGFPESFSGVRVEGERESGDMAVAVLKPLTAKVLRAGADGAPLFTENRVGKGSVIVAAERWMTAWGKDAKVGERMTHEVEPETGRPVHHEGIEWLLAELGRRFAPVAVDGDIQWGVNRTPTGWLLYLINNAGVVKYADKPEQIRPGGSDVSVDLSRIGVASAREIISGSAEAVSAGTLKTSVPYGGIKIYDLR